MFPEYLLSIGHCVKDEGYSSYLLWVLPKFPFSLTSFNAMISCQALNPKPMQI